MIEFPRPMQAPERLYQPFSSDEWHFEIKMDGYRCMAGADAGEARLATKSGADCTQWFAEVTEAIARLPGGPHIIDGEACVLDDDLGRSDFNRLQARARRRRRYPGCDRVTLVAFDLLVLDGRDVMGLPLVERKALLRQLLAGVPKASVMYLGDLPAQAELFDQVVVGLKLEGLMAKRLQSPYQPGVRSDDWRKIKRANWQEGRIWRGR